MPLMPLGRARKVELLAGLALFEHCSRRELGEVAALSVDEHKPAGAVLTRQDQAGDLAFVLVDGRVRASRNGRTLGTLGPGTIVGELSLIDGGPRTATVTALDDLHVLEISGEDFRRLLADSPHITANLLLTLAGRLRETDRQAAPRR